MSRKYIAMSVAALVVLVGLVLVAILVPGEDITRFLVIVGYIFGAVKIGYDIWAAEQERKKKAAESKEKLKAEVKIVRPYGIPVIGATRHLVYVGVDITNIGPDCNIKSVSIHVDDGPKRLIEPLMIAEADTRSDEPWEYSHFLKHKHFVLFHVSKVSTFSAEFLLKRPPESLRMEIVTTTGTTERIEGNVIQEAIRKGLAG